MENSPLISVLIPTLDRLPLFKRALGSVLAQSYPNFEIVVSDNCSTDGTRSFLESLSISNMRWWTNEARLSMDENWSKCLERSFGSYFLLLSDDDELLPDALTILMTSLRANLLNIVYGKIHIENKLYCKVHVGTGQVSSESIADFTIGYFNGGRLVYPSATLIERNYVNLTYPAVGTSTDIAMILGSDVKTIVGSVDTSVAVYRVHESNLSNHLTSQESLIRLIDWHRGLNIFGTNLILDYRTILNGSIESWIMNRIISRAFLEGLRGLRYLDGNYLTKLFTALKILLKLTILLLRKSY